MSDVTTDPFEAGRLAYIQRKAEQLVGEAALYGVSLEITRESLQPLAMGNAKSVVHVWPARNVPGELIPLRVPRGPGVVL